MNYVICVELQSSSARGSIEGQSIRAACLPQQRTVVLSSIHSHSHTHALLSSAASSLFQSVGALYIDSCNEPWAGGYSDPSKPASARSNYAFREQAIALRNSLKPNGPTALITHGANPGIVSHFVKQALLNIARDTGVKVQRPKGREEWARLMQQLGVKVVHIAEKDTQASHIIKHAGEFVNTWSIEGYCEEGKQPAELGWGTHEKRFPEDGREHADGCKAAIYLDRPGANVLMRTWTPKCGNFHGMLITHTEAISIADYFTIKDGKGEVVFRPTVNFAYHPSADAVMSMKEVRRLTSHTLHIVRERESVHACDFAIGRAFILCCSTDLHACGESMVEVDEWSVLLRSLAAF